MTDDPSIQTAIHDIRVAYVYNPYLGLASWFDLFDQALVQKRFAHCQALLDEVQQGGYSFGKEEPTYILSRKAALLLCQGINYHLLQRYDLAQVCYQASLDLHERFNDASGKGQVILACDELQKQGQGEKERQQLEFLAANPRVIGDGSIFLTAHLHAENTREALQAVAAARVRGYLTPLLEALALDSSEVQAAAASSLAWLKPGPAYPSLLTMLASVNWLVRWQAVLILQRRFQEEERAFAEYRAEVKKALTGFLEPDPTVRREIASFLRYIGNAEDTPYLIALMDDEDPDVRASAVEALAAIKDKKAIEALEHVRDGQDSRGNRIAQLALTAIQNITGRTGSQNSRTAPVSETKPGSWWWLGLLIVLPLLPPLLLSTWSQATLPAFFQPFLVPVSGTALKWLLAIGFLWGWFNSNVVKSSRQARRFHEREELAAILLTVVCTTGVVALAMAGRPRLTLPGFLLLAAATGVIIGISGGLLNQVRYGPLTRLLTYLLWSLVFIISVIATVWTYQHLGGFLGFIVAVLVYVLSMALLNMVATIPAAILGFLSAFVAMAGPAVMIGICLGVSAVYAWLYDLRIGVFAGSTCILAIAVAEIVKKLARTSAAPRLSAGMASFLVVGYAVLAWIYFFGGWKLLS